MLTNDINFNEKKQTFLHKICDFVIKFLIFADFMRFRPVFYTNIQNSLCINLQIFVSIFRLMFPRGRAPNNLVLKFVFRIV